VTRPSAPRFVPLLLVMLAFALSACAGGNAKYGCPGLPDQPMCLPPSAIYALTEGQGPPPTAQRRPSTLSGGSRAPCCASAKTKAKEGEFGWDNDRITNGDQP
jgi:hypothetical protein